MTRLESILRPDWPLPPTVRAAVTTRHGDGASRAPFDTFNLGARCGDDGDAVADNRARLIEHLALPSPPSWLRQVHGTGVATFDSPNAEEPEADASFTRSAGTVLAILTADCLPILIAADDGSAIVAAHAGWRGLAAGVIEASVACFDDPSSVSAWIGPGIGARSYEVGDEVRTAFVDHDAGAAAAFAPTRPDHWHCDLAALARRRLDALGIARVFGGNIDTHGDPRFYSYRRDGRTGRFASLVWIDDPTPRMR